MSFLSVLGLKHTSTKSKTQKNSGDYRRNLAERCEEGIAVVLLDGTVEFVNGAWASMHGYDDQDELAGKNLKRFCTRKSANEVNRFIAQTKVLNWYVATVEQRRKNGSSFPSQLKMAALKDDSGKTYGIFLVATDISRFGEMQKGIQRMSHEVEVLKTRLGRLEEALAQRGQLEKIGSESDVPAECIQSSQALPITELQQLARMANQFK